jgi:hypothetical protein
MCAHISEPCLFVWTLLQDYDPEVTGPAVTALMDSAELLLAETPVQEGVGPFVWGLRALMPSVYDEHIGRMFDIVGAAHRARGARNQPVIMFLGLTHTEAAIRRRVVSATMHLPPSFPSSPTPCLFCFMVLVPRTAHFSPPSSVPLSSFLRLLSSIMLLPSVLPVLCPLQDVLGSRWNSHRSTWCAAVVSAAVKRAQSGSANVRRAGAKHDEECESELRSG